MDRIKEIANEVSELKQWPSFSSGDSITVTYKINKEKKNVYNIFKVLLSKEKVLELLKPLQLEKYQEALELKEFSH